MIDGKERSSLNLYLISSLEVMIGAVSSAVKKSQRHSRLIAEIRGNIACDAVVSAAGTASDLYVYWIAEPKDQGIINADVKD